VQKLPPLIICSAGIITFFKLNRHETVPVSIDRKKGTALKGKAKAKAIYKNG